MLITIPELKVFSLVLFVGSVNGFSGDRNSDGEFSTVPIRLGDDTDLQIKNN